jgi:RNA polymerase sigma factor (sigma-70 family)
VTCAAQTVLKAKGPGDAIETRADPDRLALERDLVRRAQDGDTTAFEELYRGNMRRIYALCYRLAGEPALAEELTQDVFVRAWQKLGSFRGESAFSTWLYPLAVNVALSERRARRRRTSRIMATEDPVVFEKPTASTPDAGFDLERYQEHCRSCSSRTDGLERGLAEAVRPGDEGTVLAIDPSLAEGLVNEVQALATAAEQKGQEPVLVCTTRLRPALRRLLAAAVPRLGVLSVNELGPQVKLDRIGVVNVVNTAQAV